MQPRALRRGGCKPSLTHSFRKGQAGNSPSRPPPFPQNTWLPRPNFPPLPEPAACKAGKAARRGGRAGSAAEGGAGGGGRTAGPRGRTEGARLRRGNGGGCVCPDSPPRNRRHWPAGGRLIKAPQVASQLAVWAGDRVPGPPRARLPLRLPGEGAGGRRARRLDGAVPPPPSMRLHRRAGWLPGVKSGGNDKKIIIIKISDSPCCVLCVALGT